MRRSFRDDNLALSRRSDFRGDKLAISQKSGFRDDNLDLSQKYGKVFDDRWKLVRTDQGDGTSRRRWSFDDAASLFRDENTMRRDRSMRRSFRGDNLALSRKSRRRRWSVDDLGDYIPLNYLGINERSWDKSRVSSRPGESWRYGYQPDRDLWYHGVSGDRNRLDRSRKDDYGYDDRDDFRQSRRDDYGFGDRDDFRRSRRDDYGFGDRDDFRRSWKDDYGFDDRDDFRRSRFDRGGRPIFGQYAEWDSLNRYPKNDMENIYRLRRKYDRVFDYEHPHLPEYHLPRDQKRADRIGYGQTWDLNYPVLRAARHETIYSIHGDPELSRQRPLSDTALNRTSMIEGGNMYGTGVGQYAGTRRYGNALVHTQPYSQVEYQTKYKPAKVKIVDIEANPVANEAFLSSPGYEVLTLPSSRRVWKERSEYKTTDNGPRVMQLDAQKLLPSFRKSGSYVMNDARDDTDYFRGRRDFTIGAR